MPIEWPFSESDWLATLSFLRRLGCDTAGLESAVQALGQGVTHAAAQKHPLHGVGIEVS